jgi:hypothetical protein
VSWTRHTIIKEVSGGTTAWREIATCDCEPKRAELLQFLGWHHCRHPYAGKAPLGFSCQRTLRGSSKSQALIMTGIFVETCRLAHLGVGHEILRASKVGGRDPCAATRSELPVASGKTAVAWGLNPSCFLVRTDERENN